MILATMELTPDKITAFAALFFIAMFLLRLVSWMVKAKYGKNVVTIEEFDKFKASFDNKSHEICKGITKLIDVHCGTQAIGKNGVFRWYVREDLGRDLSDVKGKVGDTDGVVQDIYQQCQQCSQQCSHCQQVLDSIKSLLVQLDKKEGVNNGDDSEPL